MYYMELRNHTELLIYLVIYIQFPDLHQYTHIVTRFLSVPKIYSYVGTCSVLFDLLKLKQLLLLRMI